MNSIILQWEHEYRLLAPARLFRFDSKLERMAAISERLALRLGTESELYQAYARSLADLHAIAFRVDSPPSDAVTRLVRARELALTRHSADFFRLAHALAGSILR